MPYFVAISSVDNVILKAGYGDNASSFALQNSNVTRYYDQFLAKMYCSGLVQFLSVNNSVPPPLQVKTAGDIVFFSQNLSNQALFYSVYVQVQNSVLAGRYLLARAIISSVPDSHLDEVQLSIKTQILNSIPPQDFTG